MCTNCKSLWTQHGNRSESCKIKATWVDARTNQQVDKWRDNVKINVNVSVYSLKSPSSSADLQFMPLVLELSLILFHLLWEEFSICALCCSYSQSLQFSFLVPPGTHYCWVDRGGVMREACPTPLYKTVSLAMCYHCVRVAVGPSHHVSEVPDV